MGDRQPHFRRVKALLGSAEKARLWFKTPNPLLGDISPDEMLMAGRAMRLRQFIDEAYKMSKEANDRCPDD